MGLREFIQHDPELFKQAMSKPDIASKALSMVSGMVTWAKRNNIPIKNLRVTGPMAGPSPHYDAHFRLSRKP